MRYSKLKKLLAIALSITGLGFSAAAVAQQGCVDEINGDDPSTFITTYGGADLTCPSATFTECTANIKNGVVTKSAGCDTLSISVEILPDGGLFWESGSQDPKLLIDAGLTDSAQQGKGCVVSYGADAQQAKVGFKKADGSFFPATALALCSDGVAEVSVAPPPPPPAVSECLLFDGESKDIHGVRFSCGVQPDGSVGVPPGETRTIIVTKDTENCAEDPIGSGMYTCDSVPDFGFRNSANEIDFNNVCQCVGRVTQDGSLPVLRPACDPDPESENPENCQVINAEVPIDISIQNPKCFTIGGDRVCF